jgi:hypothetical protein
MHSFLRYPVSDVAMDPLSYVQVGHLNCASIGPLYSLSIGTKDPSSVGLEVMIINETSDLCSLFFIGFCDDPLIH